MTRFRFLLLFFVLVVSGIPGALPTLGWSALPATSQQLQERDRIKKEAEQLWEKGQLTEAITTFQKTLALERAVLGEVHKDVAVTLSWIAFVQVEREQFAEARQASRDVVAIFVKLYGEKHWLTADARNDRAVIELWPTLRKERQRQLVEADRLGTRAERLSSNGNARAALDLHKKVLELRRQALGEEHSYTAQTLNQCGFLLIEQGDYVAARPYLEKGLAVRQKVLGTEHPSTAVSLNNLGYLLMEIGDYGRAELLLREALDIRRRLLGETDSSITVSRKHLANLYIKMGRAYEDQNGFAAARDAYAKLLDVHVGLYGKDHWQATDARLSVAYVERLARADAAQVRRLKAAFLSNDRAVDLHGQGQYAEALDLGRQAAIVVREVLGEKDHHYGIALGNLAALYADTGDFARAEPLHLQALALQKAALGETHPRYALRLNNLGAFYHATGNYARAEAYLQQAVDIRQRVLGEDHSDYALSLANLAEVCWVKGDAARALKLYPRALAILLKQDKEHAFVQYAGIVNNSCRVMADVYPQVASLPEGEKFYAEVLNDLRLVLEKERRLLGETHPQFALCLGNLAKLLSYKGDFSGAEALYRQVVAIRKRVPGENHPAYAESLHNLAQAYRRQGKYAEAEPLYRQALAIRRRALGEDHPDNADYLFSLALLCQATNRSGEALRLCAESMEVQEKSLRQIFAFSAEPAMHLYLATMRSQLDVLVSLAVASQGADPSAVEVALAWTLRRKSVVLDTLCRFREAQRLLAEDGAVAERVARWRGLRQRLSDLALAPPPGVSSLTLRRRMTTLAEEADRLEAELNSRLTPKGRAEGGDVQAVRQRLPFGAAIVEFLRARPYQFRATGTAPRWRPARYFAFVFPAGDSPPRLLDLGEAGPIDSAVRDVRELIERAPRDLQSASEKGLEDEFRVAAAALFRQIFAPLKGALGGATLVYLAPDGELNRVSFEALTDDQGKYLIDSYSFAYLCCGRDLLRSRAKPGRGTVVFASPDYDLAAEQRQVGAGKLLARLGKRPLDPAPRSPASSGPTAVALRGGLPLAMRGLNWKPLANARREAVDVKDLLQDSAYGPVQSFTGADALEEIFKALAAPRVLHVATHGFFLPDPKVDADDPTDDGPLSPKSGAGGGLALLRRLENPLLRSGFVLAGANTLGQPASAAAVDDGWVTAAEVALLDLRGTDLVVLSACESGLGDVRAGEGVFGLRRAFLYAGARTLVTSLFEVPDEETRILMRRFYGNLRAGRGQSAALRDAQRDLIRERRRKQGAAHPLFWASFILVGDPDWPQGKPER